MPLSAAEMDEIKGGIGALQMQLTEWENRQESKYKQRLDEIERKANLTRVSPATDKAGPVPTGYVVEGKTGKRIPLLSSQHRLQDLPEFKGDAKMPSVGRVLRGLILGNRADDHRELDEERKALSINPDPAGGYLVDGPLAGQWIDLLRAAMVLNRAGVATIPMGSKTLTIAKLLADVGTAWHAENAALSNADPNFGAVELNARTVTAVLKLSLELSQDAANIETILQTSITKALALAIDQAGLVGTSTNSAIAPLGVINLAGRGKVTSIGAPTSWDFLVDAMANLMGSNVTMDDIGAFIAHPKVWQKMRKLKTGISGDNRSIDPPSEIADLQKYWTTSMPVTGGTTATGVIGKWSDLLYGVRSNIQVRVLQEAFMGSNLQIGMVAYARCDFVAARDASFCTCEGITVS